MKNLLLVVVALAISTSVLVANDKGNGRAGDQSGNGVVQNAGGDKGNGIRESIVDGERNRARRLVIPN